MVPSRSGTLVRSLAISVTAALGIAAPATALAGTSPRVSGPGGHTYEVVTNGNITWDQAQAASRSAGGFLATVGDAQEQTFVESLLSNANAPSGAYWFGLHETGTEGDYRPLSGVALSYNHFLAGQPDNFGGNETSGSILWSNAGDPTFNRRGFWNDLPATHGYPQVASQFPDLVPAGYVVEFRGTGSGFNNGDGDNLLGGGNGNGGGTAVPLPTAVWAFPVGALVALAARRKLNPARG